MSLMVVSSTSTSLTLSWSPPPQDQLNGVLRHYVVIVEELDSGRNLTLTSINSQIVLADLHPFYTYRVSVCSVTLGVGPCAYFQPVQLPQEGMLIDTLCCNTRLRVFASIPNCVGDVFYNAIVFFYCGCNYGMHFRV